MLFRRSFKAKKQNFIFNASFNKVLSSQFVHSVKYINFGVYTHRKMLSRFIPFNSNVPHHFKMMAGRSYFRTARSHTNSTFELKNQLEVVNAILKLKAFPNRLINRMKSHTITNLSKTDSAKKFLGTTTFDKINLRHSFVTEVFTESAIDQNLFFHPMSVPGPKLEQYIFTIKKMRKILNF